MGKGPSGSKRQQGAANQRDTRHENGLVGPGKRVQKQKSNGHLNGHAKPESNSSTPPLPGTPLPTNGYARHSISAEPSDPKMAGENGRTTSFSGPSEASFDPYLSNTEGAASFENHRQIDVNAAKDPAVHHDSGPLSFVLTVLRSCPLGDTLAILIVLLQIPPTFLSIVHLLFTTLTFVPPSTAISSGLTFTDMLQGTFGSPALGTTFLIDIVFLLIWIFLWDPLQNIALDLAQMVIALTLGGGTSGKKAGMHNVFWCFAIIGVTQFLRNSSIRQAGLRALIPAYIRFGNPDPDDPLEPSSSIGRKKFDHGWLRSILAIHILTQGVVRYIRDWYVRRENRDNSASVGDPEAAKLPVDGNAEALQTQHSDNDTTPSLPIGSVALTTKKKKKHSTQVRMRQPLWAALASTKVVMVKEYETSHTAAESAGTNATDLNNLGNAPFDSEADRIWISYVGSEEVYFSTSFFPTHAVPEDDEAEASKVDLSKPFFVKVNNTIWHPTRITPLANSDLVEQGTKWNGEIFGLTPTASYQCEFVSTADNTVLFSTSVRTLQSPTADLVAGVPTNPQTSARPGSPVSTLKASITSSDTKLTEEKNRVNRLRKDHRTRVGAARADLDKLNGRILSTGGTDDRLRQKAQQNKSHLKQAEESVASLNAEIDELATIPEKEKKQYSSCKSSTYSQRDKHHQSRKELDASKQTIDTNINSLKHESTSIQQKTESKQARLMFLNTKHESIEDANKQGLDEAQRHERERTAKKNERQTIRKFYTERLQALSGQMYEGTTALNAVNGAIETLRQVQAEMYAQNQSPSSSAQNLQTFGDSIPEGLNVTASPWNPMPAHSGPFPNNFSMFGPVGQSSHRTRGRSSSMLSNVSKFTQSSDEFTGNGTGRAQIFLDAREERKDSSGSASVSGSGSGSGSVVDPKSPTVGNGRPARW